MELFAYKNYVTDKKSFGYDESGARIGETPNIAMDAGSEELAKIIAASPRMLSMLAILVSDYNEKHIEEARKLIREVRSV